MNIVVCIKVINGAMNPMDACALEAALRLPNARVTVISMSRMRDISVLKHALYCGANRAILLNDNTFAASDTLATSYTLSLAISMLRPDLVICGRKSIDGETEQTGPALATRLQYSFIPDVLEFCMSGGNLFCKTRKNGTIAQLPALATVELINTLRFPSFIQRNVAEVEIWDADFLKANRNKCGQIGSPTQILNTYSCEAGRRTCKWITAEELSEVIQREVVKKTRIVHYQHSSKKLDLIWVIGEELKEIGLSIAEKVQIIPRKNPEEIADLARRMQPKVILWPADSWGRNNAPQTAVILETGLCANCTFLETDGDKLFMHRPALQNSIMAKIICNTDPQMATVQISEPIQSNIIVSVGRGAKAYLSKIQQFAGIIGASIMASRGAVDMGLLPYEHQVGLTGKNINSKVYLAFGISGAVQHTCGIEQAGCIIAINRDKDARIFDYADYGIVADIHDVLTINLKL